jgi:hypothetical protein
MIVSIYLTKRCFKLHSIIYFVVEECYIYRFVVSVDHFSCSNESQFEKWWQDRKQNPVGVTYTIHHSIISNKNKVSQTVFIFCQIWHKIPTWLCFSQLLKLALNTNQSIFAIHFCYHGIWCTHNFSYFPWNLFM